MALTVSALAQTAGLSADTVRYYERVGLLQVADRGQCPCGHTETLLRGRLAEVRRETGKAPPVSLAVTGPGARTA
jgi:hypothetical protein